MQLDMTRGPVTGSILKFAAPMIAGNLLQQLYNVVDTLIVGQVLGAGALAAVSASYTVMVFITSVILGLCMGSGVLFSMQYTSGRREEMKNAFVLSFLMVGALTLVVQVLALRYTEPLMALLQIPEEVFALTGSYLHVIFYGLVLTFLYNYFASLLRAVGDGVTPLIFLAAAALLNVGLDLLLVLVIPLGVAGAAIATVTAQGVSALGIGLWFWLRQRELRPARRHLRWDGGILRRLAQYSLLTCLQQSVMNFGILMIQGLVNSFGVAVMAGFGAAVKIDSFAYMPVQDFGNAFSTYIAQNHGAGQGERIRRGLRSAVISAALFCLVISAGVFLLARPLMGIFLRPEEGEAIAVGVQYLRIEGACYCGIGCLFLLYGLYRGLGRPGFSVVLTVISLGTRVGLAYWLAPNPAFGLAAIWWAIPIGWFLADLTGLLYFRCRKGLLPQ